MLQTISARWTSALLSLLPTRYSCPWLLNTWRELRTRLGFLLLPEHLNPTAETLCKTKPPFKRLETLETGHYYVTSWKHGAQWARLTSNPQSCLTIQSIGISGVPSCPAPLNSHCP
jgi:hypothetical protein